jgi:hypothetical protein
MHSMCCQAIKAGITEFCTMRNIPNANESDIKAVVENIMPTLAQVTQREKDPEGLNVFEREGQPPIAHFSIPKVVQALVTRYSGFHCAPFRTLCYNAHLAYYYFNL